MKTICLCAAVFALTLANAAGGNMGTKVLSLLSGSALLFSCIAATAQQTTKAVAPIPQPMENSSAKAQTTRPSPELQSLKALSDQWSLAVKFEPNPEVPDGLVATGEEPWRAGPGGFTVLEEERLPHRWSVAQDSHCGAIHLYTPAGLMEWASVAQSEGPKNQEARKVEFGKHGLTLLGEALSKEEIDRTL